MSNVVELNPLAITRRHATCPFCDHIGNYDPDKGCVVCDGCQAEGPAASGCCADAGDDADEAAAWAFWDERLGRGKPDTPTPPAAPGTPEERAQKGGG
jgi:hypothetical protein